MLHTCKRTVIACHEVQIGWINEHHSYRIKVYDTSGTDPWARRWDDNCVVDVGNAQSPIADVYHLVCRSWSLVRWDLESELLRTLALEPCGPAHEFEAAHVLRLARKDPRTQLRETLEMLCEQLVGSDS